MAHNSRLRHWFQKSRDFWTQKETQQKHPLDLSKEIYVNIYEPFQISMKRKRGEGLVKQLTLPLKNGATMPGGKTLGNKKTPPPERFERSARRDGTFGLSTRDDQGAAALAVRGCLGTKNGFFTFRKVCRFREG